MRTTGSLTLAAAGSLYVSHGGGHTPAPRVPALRGATRERRWAATAAAAAAMAGSGGVAGASSGSTSSGGAAQPAAPPSEQLARDQRLKRSLDKLRSERRRRDLDADTGGDPGASSASSGSSSSSGGPSIHESSTDGKGTGSRPAPRAPRIPPLPYWCDGVAVVGLPAGQLVFCFQTPTQTAAAARRQLRAEAAYGAHAVKLAAMAGDRVQAVLDRWQYAVAQQELAELDVRPRLWWMYESARKAMNNDAAAAAAAAAQQQQPAAVVQTRRQRRLAARLAAAAEAEAAREQQQQEGQAAAPAAAAATALPPEAGSSTGSSSGSRSSSSSSAPTSSDGSSSSSGGLLLSPAAFQLPWEVCTVRALSDGTTIFKFGGFEPLPATPPVSAVTQGGAQQPAAGQQTGSSNSSDSSSSRDGGDGSSSSYWEEERRQQQQQQQRQLLLQQQLQRFQEGVAWSHALRLGVKFDDQIEITMRKLQAFVSSWEQGQSSASTALTYQLYATYEDTLEKVGKQVQQAAEQQQQQQEEAGSGGEDAEQVAAAAAAVVVQGEQEQGEQQQQWQQREQQRQQREQQQQPALQEGEQAAAAGNAARLVSLLASLEQQQQRQQEEEEEEQQGVDQAAAASSRGAANASSGSSSSSAAGDIGGPSAVSGSRAAAAADAVQRRNSRDALLPRPQSQRPTPSQQSAAASLVASAAAAATGNAAAAAAAADSSAAAAARQQPLLLRLLPAAAALVAGFAAAARLVLRRLRGCLVGCWLALYRRLPVSFRRTFWGSWPPQFDAVHVSASLAALMAENASVAADGLKMGQQAYAAAGFDLLGRTQQPLADLQAWQVERLTLCGVRDLGMYRIAFTHKSALPSHLRLGQSYERLEFLGDAQLGLSCRTLLMQRCPNSDEGDMTKLNSLLGSRAYAARYATFLGLHQYILLEPKMFREAAQHTPTILADVFESLLGALYLDQGFDAAHRFTVRVLDACVEWEQLESAEDFKGMLCRYASYQQKPQPRYRVRSMMQKEYKEGLVLPWWTVDVSFRGEVMGSGGSFDKRDAAQGAAREALQRLGQLPPLPQ